MSKYTVYAKRALQLHDEAVQAYKEATEKLQKAESKLIDARNAGSDNTRKQAELFAAEAAAADARGVYVEIMSRLTHDYNTEFEKLDAAAVEAHEAGYTVNPAEIDGNALELLKSGIMGANDYETMIEKFSGNITMSRMIGKYAKDAAEAEENPAARNRLHRVHAAAMAEYDADADTLKKLREYISDARSCTGLNTGEAGYAAYLQESFNSETRAALQSI